MKVSRREYVDTLSEAFTMPLNYLPHGDSPSYDKPKQWLNFTGNAMATGVTRVAVPFAAAHFADKDAKARHKGFAGRCGASLVGLASGMFISTMGGVVNAAQTLGGVCMVGVSSGIATFKHGLHAMDEMKETNA